MISSNKSTNKKQDTNKRLTGEQVRLLEATFKVDQKLDSDRKFHLAQQLGLPARQVATWYQNKRARWKNQSLEMEYKALQQKLENALAENEKLECQVQRLHQELENARNMLLHSTSSSNNSFNACDEEGSSYLLVGGPDCRLDSELYACLIGSHGVEGNYENVSN